MNPRKFNFLYCFDWQSVEWNDEPNEEQGGTELLPGTAGDVCAQSSEKKEDHVVNNTEENEWDRLLRLRWVVHMALGL